MAEPAPAQAGAAALGGVTVGGVTVDGAAWPALPTETEIYILPDGRVVIADLPAELAPLAAALGAAESCEITPNAEPDPTL